MRGLGAITAGPAQPQGAQPQPEQMPQGEQMPEGDAPTPEEQAMYDSVVQNALRVIQPEGEELMAPNIEKSLTASDNPILNLATTTVSIVSGLVESAAKAGQKIPGDVLMPAGAEILEVLVEEAEAAGLNEYSEEDMERAWLMAVDLYREQAKAAGTLDEEALKEDYAFLQQAEEEGRIDEVLPGAREWAERNPQDPAQMQPEQGQEEQA